MSPPPPEEFDAEPGNPAGPGPAANPYIDEEAAADRASESGPLFADAVRPAESGADPGLIAGGPDDPVLVAGVGYPLLGDLAVGTVVAYRVASWERPGVAVADCSHTPIATYQTVSDGAYETLLIVGAEKRGGELNDGTPSAAPGTIHEHDAADYAARPTELVERVGESAMGSNTVENVVVVSTSIGELPADTRIYTIEPGYDSWGLAVDEFTSPVEAQLDALLARVRDAIDDALNDQ